MSIQFPGGVNVLIYLHDNFVKQSNEQSRERGKHMSLDKSTSLLILYMQEKTDKNNLRLSSTFLLEREMGISHLKLITFLKNEIISYGREKKQENVFLQIKRNQI